MEQSAAFWAIQGPGWVLVAYLVFAQCTSALNYKWGVRMGTQESAETITHVGVAFWWGLALADLVIYTPLLALGLVGHWSDNRQWGIVVLAGALGITIYWPLVCLATIWSARGTPHWSLPKERQYWVVLPIIAGWGAYGLRHLIVADVEGLSCSSNIKTILF